MSKNKQKILLTILSGGTILLFLILFVYGFNAPGRLQEAGNMSESASPYWWLNSGGVMEIKEGRGATNQGDLPKFSRFRILYNRNNPIDTDQGYHPQNIFRLVTRGRFQNFSEESYFLITALNQSESPNRNVSNGLLLLLRYQDGNNLYYAGLRVDGTAVIKKKIAGEYFTLAQASLFEGAYAYDRDKNPNILPANVWLGIRAEIKNSPEGALLSLSVDKGERSWQKVLEVMDEPGDLDGTPIWGEGFGGIRTDFMDVEFKNFKIIES